VAVELTGACSRETVPNEERIDCIGVKLGCFLEPFLCAFHQILHLGSPELLRVVVLQE